MREFLVSQMDYIFFIYGLAFIFLAMNAYFISRRDKAQPFWKLVALFGLLHGILEWMNMASFSVGEAFLFKLVRLVFLVLSFLCLCEVARGAAVKSSGALWGRWVYVPLLLLIVVSGWGLGGLTGINILSRYILGFAGGLLAARVIAVSAPARALNVFAWVLVCYVATQLFPPAGSFFPASMFNQDVFLATTSIPIQLVRTLLALFLAGLLWHQNFRDDIRALSLSLAPVYWRNAVFFVAGLVVVLVAGWGITDFIGRNGELRERRELFDEVQIAAAIMDPSRVKALSGTTADLDTDNYKFIQRQFLNVFRSDPAVLYVYLFGRKDGKNIFLLDTQPPGKKRNAEPLAAPGEVYEEDAELLGRMFASGGAVTVGPETDKWGTFVSGMAAVRSHADDSVVGILGIDYDASEWHAKVHAYRLGPILVTLLLSIMLLLFFVIYIREQETGVLALEKGRILKQLLSQLEGEHKNLQTIFDSTQVGLLLLDGEFRVKRLNQVLLDIGTQDAFTIIDHQIGVALSCVHAQGVNAGCGTAEHCKHCLIRNMAGQVLRTGQKIREAEVCHEVRTAAGQRSIWLEVNACPIQIDGGTHILFSLADITRRKVLEQELVQSEERHRELFERMLSCFVSIEVVPGPDGKPVDLRILEVNRECERLTGMSKDLLVGKTIYELIPGLEKKWLDILGGVARGGEPCHFTEYASGLEKWFEGSAFSVKRGFVAVTFVDITGQKKAQEENVRHTKELEVFYKASIGREERILELKKQLE